MRINKIIKLIYEELPIATFLSEICDYNSYFYEATIDDGYVIYFEVPKEMLPEPNQNMNAKELIPYLMKDNLQYTISVDYDSINFEIEKYIKVLDIINLFDIIITVDRLSTLKASNILSTSATNVVKKQNELIINRLTEMGIERGNILFTNYNDISYTLRDRNVLFHLNNIDQEIESINSININNSDWKKQTNKIMFEKISDIEIDESIDNMLKQF